MRSVYGERSIPQRDRNETENVLRNRTVRAALTTAWCCAGFRLVRHGRRSDETWTGRRDVAVTRVAGGPSINTATGQLRHATPTEAAREPGAASNAIAVRITTETATERRKKRPDRCKPTDVAVRTRRLGNRTDWITSPSVNAFLDAADIDKLHHVGCEAQLAWKCQFTHTFSGGRFWPVT